MTKDRNRIAQLRQSIAQRAARLMADEGVADYGQAKRKASRQLGISEDNCMPTNAEIEAEIRIFHALYHDTQQAQTLQQLRADAHAVMQLLARFNPHLTGAVLDGTAGRHAVTDIHLYAESLKEVEIFLLNQQIPYDSGETHYRDYRRHAERRKIPTFTLEGPSGTIRLSVFDLDAIRNPPKSPTGEQPQQRISLAGLAALLQTSTGVSDATG